MTDSYKQLTKLDLYRYCGKYSRFLHIKNWFINPCYKYTYLLRKTQFYQSKTNNSKRFISIYYLIRFYLVSVRLMKVSFHFGFQIGRKTVLGNGLYIGHYGRVIISGDAILGDNCNIATGVTIGNENRGERKGAPKIGSCVWFGTNSVIVGKIEIGSNVLIAPNTLVNFDVPSNSIVIGNPGRIINSDTATDLYICNKV